MEYYSPLYLRLSRYSRNPMEYPEALSITILPRGSYHRQDSENVGKGDSSIVTRVEHIGPCN